MSLQRNKKQDQLNTRDKQQSPDTYVIGKNWLDHSKACAIVDQMLLTGANMNSLVTSGRKKKSVENHINHLRTEHGLTVDKHDGIYRFGCVNKPTIEDTYKKDIPSSTERIHTESEREL